MNLKPHRIGVSLLRLSLAGKIHQCFGGGPSLLVSWTSLGWLLLRVACLGEGIL